MNQNFIIVDDFYDIAHQYYKSFFEDKLVSPKEAIEKISSVMGRDVNVSNIFNEIKVESPDNQITANLEFDFIAVIYLTMPSECVSKKGLSFYRHKKTELDSFPNEYACKINGWQSMDDIEKSFNTGNLNDWEEYANVFVKYNRCIIFKADYWHSYGSGFGDSINNSMLYQKLLIKDVYC
jgi:hypothetical protein